MAESPSHAKETKKKKKSTSGKDPIAVSVPRARGPPSPRIAREDIERDAALFPAFENDTSPFPIPCLSVVEEFGGGSSSSSENSLGFADIHPLLSFVDERGRPVREMRLFSWTDDGVLVHPNGKSTLVCPPRSTAANARAGPTALRWSHSFVATKEWTTAPPSNGTNRFRCATIVGLLEWNTLEFPYPVDLAVRAARVLSGDRPSADASWETIEEILAYPGASEATRSAVGDRVCVVVDRWLAGRIPGYLPTPLNRLFARWEEGDGPQTIVGLGGTLKDSHFLRSMERQLHRTCGILPDKAIRYHRGRGKNQEAEAWKSHAARQIRRNATFACARVLFRPPSEMIAHASTDDVPDAFLVKGGVSFAFRLAEAVLASPTHLFLSAAAAPEEEEKEGRREEEADRRNSVSSLLRVPLGSVLCARSFAHLEGEGRSPF